MRYNLAGACNVGACNGYELMRNLDFRSPSSYRSGRVDTSFTTGSGWNPINDFNTTFEGNGNTLDHLYINRGSTDYVGLFGYTSSNARIRNIGLPNVSVYGRFSVGGLSGRNYGSIAQSYATGSVSGNDSAGGLVGLNYGSITCSYATGSVGGYSYVGGLVGFNNNSSISQSYATGSVSGNFSVGGLVGANIGSSIAQSYATGYVRGGVNIGGLVGVNNGSIAQSYATGYVTGYLSSYFYIGGLVGLNYGSIAQSYWNTDAIARGVGYNNRSVDVRGLPLSDMKNPTGTLVDSIRGLGDGFIYRQGFLPQLKLFPDIYFSSIGNKTYGDDPFVLTASSSAGLPLLYSASSTIIHFHNNTVRIRGLGTVNITAYSVANDTVTFASSTQTISISKIPHTITFETLSNKTYGDDPFVLTASSSVGLPLLYSASSTIIRIQNKFLTIRGAGTVSITAYSVANDTVDFAFATQTISISKIPHTITFETLSNKTYGDDPFVLTASSSAGLPLLYSASSTIIRIQNKVLTIRGAGTVSITAYSVANDTVTFASSTQTLSISKAPQSIDIGELQHKTLVDLPFTIHSESSASLPVLYSASSTLIRIRNNEVIINGAGTVSITAYSSGNTNYLEAFVTHTIITTEFVRQRTDLFFHPIPTLTVGQKYILSTTTNSPVFVKYASAHTNIARIDGDTLFALSEGIGLIYAEQIGNWRYEESTVSRSVVVIGTDTVRIPHPLTFIEKENSAIRIYPNPANDYITIQTDKNQTISFVKVYDMMGDWVMGIGYIGNDGISIDVKTLPKGEYILVMYGEKKEILKVEKIIIH